MFFTYKKLCASCQESKPLDTEHYHSDKTTKDGYASSCKACRNAKRQKPKKIMSGPDLSQVLLNLKPARRPKIPKNLATLIADDVKGKITHVPITPELDRDTITKAFLALKDRLGTSFSLSVDSRGIFHLQAHGNPSRHFRSPSMEELMEMV